jgi:hypothetical protein
MPSYSQVSAKYVLLSRPPNRTIRSREASYAIAERKRAGVANV